MWNDNHSFSLIAAGNVPTFPATPACCSWHYFSSPLCQPPEPPLSVVKFEAWESSTLISLPQQISTLALTATSCRAAKRELGAHYRRVITHTPAFSGIPSLSLFTSIINEESVQWEISGKCSLIWFLFPRSMGECGAVPLPKSNWHIWSLPYCDCVKYCRNRTTRAVIY